MGTNDLNATFMTYTEPTFQVLDYVVYALFLCISGAVGIFFSCRGQQNTDEYFFGGKKMKAVPVGISTGVSFLAAGVMVGLPAEVYLNGYSYVIGTISGSVGYFIGCMLVSYMLQPHGMTSVNEYIAKRYRSTALTYLANICVLLCIFQYMAVCILGTVIAFNSVTGGQVSVILGLVIGAVVGTFYTAVGGLKAVVWTDVIQSGIMIGGMIMVIIKSAYDTPGGMAEIYRLGVKYGRLHPPVWSFDMTIRHTFWGLVMGFFFYWGIWCIQPACVQRLCSTQNKRESYKVSAIASFMFLLFGLLPAWAGVNIFGYYASKGCDVFQAKWINNNDVILYFVRERLNYPGFQGLFIAALYAGSLSSLSSGLNAASAIMWKDTIKPLLKVEVSEKKATFISKIIVVVFGVLSMVWCYTLYSFGGLILQVAASIDASMYGAYFAMFVLSLCFRYASAKGAIAGLLTSFIFTLWLGLASLFYGKSYKPVLPTFTDTCGVANVTANGVSYMSMGLNITTPSTEPPMKRSFMDSLYSVSYCWLSLICIAVSLLVSLVVTGCTGPGNMKNLDETLILPPCRKGYFGQFRIFRLGSRCNNDSDPSTDDEDDDDDDDIKKEEKMKLSPETISNVEDV